MPPAPMGESSETAQHQLLRLAFHRLFGLVRRQPVALDQGISQLLRVVGQAGQHLRDLDDLGRDSNSVRRRVSASSEAEDGTMVSVQPGPAGCGANSLLFLSTTTLSHSRKGVKRRELFRGRRPASCA